MFKLNGVPKLKQLIGEDIEDRIAGIEIQNTPLKFFQAHIGAIEHPQTHKPSQPFPYQYKCSYPFVKHKMKLIVKSHKIGLSTWFLFELLWKAYYEYPGYDILITSQIYRLAKDHLRDIRRYLYQSPTLSKTVLYSGTREMSDERTKVETVFVQSPLSNQATRIIAVPFAVSSMESWKRVGHIHASDVAANKYVDDSEVFAAMFSRTVNTDGSITIETIPAGMRGTVYSLWRDDPTIWKKALPYDLGVQAGLISEEEIERQRRRWGPLFPSLWEAVFLPSLSAAYPAAMGEDLFTGQEDLEF